VTFDPTQRFLSLVPGGNGIIYAIQSDGALLWYNNTGWTTGAGNWANGGNARTIGSAWHQFDTVLASNDGTLFAFRPDGTLLWYQYIVSNLSTGAGSWHPASGSQIGSGWNRFTRVFGGWNGVIYGLDALGNLFWYRYAANNGSFSWGANTGAKIGIGWNSFLSVWADPNGVIYGQRQADTLHWWRYVVPNLSTGVGSWANGGNAITIGVGWGDTTQKTAFSNTSGVTYTVALSTATVPGNDNVLTWYKLQNSEHVDTAGVSWTGGTGIAVGSGFTMQRSAALQGYPSSLSTPLGGSVGIKVSTTWPNYTASVVRLAPSAGAPVTVVGPTTNPGRLQLVQSGYRSAGCGWSDDFTVSVQSGWSSGIYAAQLTSPYGSEQDVVFIVRPSAPVQRIAVVVPTNTYNAYNTWGGHNQYTVGQAGVQRVVTLLRPSTTAQSRVTGFINHVLYSDLLLLQWMTASNIQFDCYTDGDLDLSGSTWLPSYKAVVLCTHPEYATETARTNINNYLQAGGRVVYTGGNGIYEKVAYSTDRTAVVFRTPGGDRALFSDLNEPASDILGVDTDPATYMDFASYRVLTNHAFLAGTGLSVGSTFGASGYNNAASGWEVDNTPGGIPGMVVIALGLNPNGGADMAYVPKPNGGWVFTAGSLTYNGAVPYDSAIQQIMTNVFTAALQ
jgi:N,N-dimethylformamidase